MQKKSFYFIIILFFSVSLVQAQHSNTTIDSVAQEKQLITQTIEMYFDGWMTGDTTKLGKAMHATCKLKNIKDDEVVVYDRAKYLSFFEPRAGVKGASTRIISIDVTDDIAAAKCEIEIPKRLFTDYFNMMKVGGHWYIVDKIATNKAK